MGTSPCGWLMVVARDSVGQKWRGSLMTMVQRRIFHPSLAWELDERLIRTVRRIVDLPGTEEQSSWQVGGWWFLAA